MLRRTICKRMLSGKDILQMLHILSESNSSDEKSELSRDAYIPGIASEPSSRDECFTEIAQNDFSSEFQKEENSSINTNPQHARSA
ncbi:hypothetical protein AVEN_177569-1 [Araneus ventricosus]|uniref:Uncharacterized protein n=1 Tax=Araneus ventricosus TaxID=182803 RepID=A0A4Y2E0I0_ARAVE|nr:hypothetical protein AVEN_177569-1 [Araneus ventricosus]